MQTSPSIYQELSKDTVAVAESLSVMMQKERTVYKKCNYLHPHPMQTQDSVITESDRLALVDWCYSIVDTCELGRESVAMSMDLADRFLSRPGVVALEAIRDRCKFQLVVVTSLYIAIKVQDKSVLGSESLSALSQGSYSVGDIEAMEVNILKGLSWRINAPISIYMAHDILALTLPHVNLRDSTWAFILDEVRFQCESAVRDYCLATQRPSTVALGVIFTTLNKVQVDGQDRQAMYRALLIVMNEECDSPEALMAWRKLNDNDVVTEAEDLTIVSDTDTSSSEVTFCSSDMVLEKYNLDDQIAVYRRQSI